MERRSDISPANDDSLLQDWHGLALKLEDQVNQVVVGQQAAVRLCNIAILARGHVLLEGNVGVGKTTLLRCIARAIGGAYERIEGTIDLMPSDLIYYTYVNEQGRPQVDPGPLLKSGESLAIFFFNEVNRARPQMHSLMLRVMAERSITAFNREHYFPHLLVFADRNRVEKEETFEIPAAARDRFLMEIPIEIPADPAIQIELMFSTRFHDVTELVNRVPPGLLPFAELNGIAAVIQKQVRASETLQKYILELCQAIAEPAKFGVTIEGVNMEQLVQAGVSPRGMSMLLRAARVKAWLDGREMLVPEDIHFVFFPSIAHRVFFTPVYEMRRASLVDEFMREVINRVAAP